MTANAIYKYCWMGKNMTMASMKDWWQQFGVVLNQHVFEIIDSSQFGKQIED